MAVTINYSKAQKKLFIQWCIFSGLIFTIYMVQTLTGRYNGHISEVWEWVFQYLTPPLTLMIGIFISRSSSLSTEVEVDRFYYRLALGFSYFFLILLFLSSLLVPAIHVIQNQDIVLTEINASNQKTITDAFKQYNSFLIPIQGLTTLALGLFFTKTGK